MWNVGHLLMFRWEQPPPPTPDTLGCPEPQNPRIKTVALFLVKKGFIWEPKPPPQKKKKQGGIGVLGIRVPVA